MKITKKGDPVAGWEGRWSCDDCGCEWEMEKTDPEPVFTSDQRDGDFYQMSCPTCGRRCYRQKISRRSER